MAPTVSNDARFERSCSGGRAYDRFDQPLATAKIVNRPKVVGRVSDPSSGRKTRLHTLPLSLREDDRGFIL